MNFVISLTICVCEREKLEGGILCVIFEYSQDSQTWVFHAVSLCVFVLHLLKSKCKNK